MSTRSFEPIQIQLITQHAATIRGAATQAGDRSVKLRAVAEQRIIDAERHATERALAQDRQVWRARRREVPEVVPGFSLLASPVG